MTPPESTIQIPPAAAQRELRPWLPQSAGPDGWRTWVSERRAALSLGGLLTIALVIALSASGTEPLLPQVLHLALPSWLAGPFGHVGINLGVPGLTALLSLMFLCWVIVVRASEMLSAKSILIGIGIFHVIVLLAPPLLSNDVFSYIAYGRIGRLYHFNPYVWGPSAIQLDHVYAYIDQRWIYTPTDYGPLFTALSYLLAPLTIAANVIGYKLIAGLSSLVIVWGVWKCAQLRGLDPAKAAAYAGLNPVMVLYGVGGGHNDMLMLAVLVLGIYAVLLQKERTSGALMVVATAIKLTGGLVLPFAIAARSPSDVEETDSHRRRRAVLSGVALAGVGGLALSVGLFGTGELHLLGTLRSVQSQGGVHSIPGLLLTILGLTSLSGAVGAVLDVVFLLCLAWLLRKVWLDEMDWIAGSGWATVILLLTAGLLLPWYVVWLLPLAALSHDRRLFWFGIGLTALGLTTI